MEAARDFKEWGSRLQLSLEECGACIGKGTIQGILPRGWGAGLTGLYTTMG